MTIAEFLRVALRRWYVILAGTLLTVASCWALVAGAPSVYYSRMELRFVEEGVGPTEGFLTTGSEVIVPFVAGVERVINDGRPVLPFNSREAFLYGIGVRQGTRVAMPNYGSQWMTSYPIPALVVEVVDESPAAVLAAHNRALTEIRGVTQALQAQHGVPADARISVVQAASEPEVASVGPTRRETLRALVAATVVGAAITAGAALEWDRWVLRGGRRRRGRGSAEPSGADHALAAS